MSSRLPPSLLRVASPLLAARGLSSVMAFAIPVVLARSLTPHEYGTYKQFFLVASTCFLAGQLGITASLYYFVPRAGADRSRYVLQALCCLAVLGALAALVVLAGAGELGRRFDNPDLVRLAPALALYVWAVIGAAPLEISLTSSGRTGWAGAAYVLSDLTRTAALVGPIMAYRSLTLLAWAAAGFACLRLCVAWTMALAGALGRVRPPTRATLRAQLRYALPFGGAVMLTIAQMQLPPYLVAAITEPTTFAIYAIGMLQIPFTDVLYSPVAEVMMVRLARTDAHGAPAVFREAVSQLAMFFLPMAAFLWAAAPVIIPTMYTERYDAAVPIFLVAIGELLLQPLPVDGLLRALDGTRSILRNNVVRLAFTLVAVPTGLFTFGLPGAMGGYVATQALAKTLLLRAGARRLGVRASDLLPLRRLAAWAGRSAVIFAAVTVLRLAGPWIGWRFLLAAMPVGGALWLASLYSAGILGRRSPAPSVAGGTNLG